LDLALATDLPTWVSAQYRGSANLEKELRDKLDKAGIEVRHGQGSLVDANTIRVESDYGRIRADYVALATGSRPDFGGQALGPTFVNIDQLLRLSYLPKRLLIIGGSYMGCEIASILQSLGCTVTLIEKRHLLSDWDPYIGGFLAHALHSSEVSLHFRQEVDLQYPGGTAEEPSFPVEGGLTSINSQIKYATVLQDVALRLKRTYCPPTP
jgi:glutathione reductase (NADPH)